MSWLILAFLAAFFTAMMDLFIKLSAGKISDGFSGFVINLAAALVLAAFVLYLIIKGEPVFNFKGNSLIYSIIAGVSIGIATICFIRVYSLGTNLSIASPIYRVGTVLIAIVFAILFLKEALSLRYVIGFVLSLAGLYLLISK